MQTKTWGASNGMFKAPLNSKSSCRPLGQIIKLIWWSMFFLSAQTIERSRTGHGAWAMGHAQPRSWSILLSPEPRFCKVLAVFLLICAGQACQIWRVPGVAGLWHAMFFCLRRQINMTAQTKNIAAVCRQKNMGRPKRHV